MVYMKMGEIYKHLGDLHRAFEFHKKALKDNLEIYGKKHPDVATCLIGLGNDLKEMGELDSALVYYQRALKSSVADFAIPN